MPSIKKNIAYNVTLQVLNVLFPIVTVPYISRILGVENIGIVNFTLTYVSYFALFAALGIGYYGIREVAKHKDNLYNVSKIFTEIFSINIFSTVISALVFLLSVYTIPTLSEERTLFLIAGITLYMAPLSIDWLFQGLEDFKVITIRSLTIRALCLVALFVFVRERSDVIPYVLLNVGSVVFANLWNFWYARTKYIKFNFHKLELQKHVKPIFVFFIAVIAMSIFTVLDTIILGFMSNYTEVGFYTSATKIIRLIMPMFSAISIVLLSRISFNREHNGQEENNVLLQKSLDLHFFLIAPAILGLLFIAPRFTPLFFGKEFVEVVILLQILSFLLIFDVLCAFFELQILVGMGYERLFIKSLLVSAAVNISLNLILIPSYGAVGSAIASVMSAVTRFSIELFYIKKYKLVSLKWKGLGQNLSMAFPIVIFYFILNSLIVNDWFFLVLFVIISIFSYILLQYFGAKHYLLKSLIRQLKSRNE